MIRVVFLIFALAGLQLAGCASSGSQSVAEGPVKEAMDKYLSKNNFKAYAIQVDLENRRNNDIYGFSYNMKSQEIADQRAIDFCLQQALGEGERCVIYARGNAIVFTPTVSGAE